MKETMESATPEEMMETVINHSVSIDEINLIRYLIIESAHQAINKTTKKIIDELNTMVDICDKRILELSDAKKQH